MCEMSKRQKVLYQAVKKKIMYEDLVVSNNNNNNIDNKSTSLLMNLVMQFRKVNSKGDVGGSGGFQCKDLIIILSIIRFYVTCLISDLFSYPLIENAKYIKPSVFCWEV